MTIPRSKRSLLNDLNDQVIFTILQLWIAICEYLLQEKIGIFKINICTPKIKNDNIFNIIVCIKISRIP